MNDLSSIKGNDAFDAWAAATLPMLDLISDKTLVGLMADHNGGTLKAMDYMLNNKRESVVKVLAAMKQQTVEEYLAGCTVMSLPADITTIIFGGALGSLFSSAASTAAIKKKQ